MANSTMKTILGMFLITKSLQQLLTFSVSDSGFPLVQLKYSLRSSKKNTCFSSGFLLKKRAGGRFSLLFIISYCMLSLQIITFPQGYVGDLRSNINKTKHQILIQHKFV